MSPSGNFGVDGEASYSINRDGSILQSPPNYRDESILPVINLNADAITGGSGTVLDPFVVE